MIHKGHVSSYCRKGEMDKIENYDKAIADKENMWVCHHRLELTLDGEYAHSQDDLIRMGMYWHRPYFELIFLPKGEHQRLHVKFQDCSKALKAAVEASAKARTGKPREILHGEFAKLYIEHFGKYPFEDKKTYKRMYWKWKRSNHLEWEDNDG